MELRSFINIFAKDKGVFFSGIFIAVLFGILFFHFQGDRYLATLSVNVTRSGPPAGMAEYQYDQFYRLQADERFADTVVRWLLTPSMRSAIGRAAGVEKNEIWGLEAKRLSSQLVEVTYEASSPEKFGAYAEAITQTLNRESAALNKEAQAKDWFVVIASPPSVEDARYELMPIVLGSFFLGLFVSFWTVLVRWYWKKGR